MKQYFGSKLARFETKKIKNKLGPGEYFKQEKEDLININKTSSPIFVPFASSVKRFNASEEKDYCPGPGDYNPFYSEKIKKTSKSSEKKFGSNEIRFNNMYNLKWKNQFLGLVLMNL